MNDAIYILIGIIEGVEGGVKFCDYIWYAQETGHHFETIRGTNIKTSFIPTRTIVNPGGLSGVDGAFIGGVIENRLDEFTKSPPDFFYDGYKYFQDRNYKGFGTHEEAKKVGDVLMEDTYASRILTKNHHECYVEQIGYGILTMYIDKPCAYEYNHIYRRKFNIFPF